MEDGTGKQERWIGKARGLDVWWDGLDGRKTQEEEEFT